MARPLAPSQHTWRQLSVLERVDKSWASTSIPGHDVNEQTGYFRRTFGNRFPITRLSHVETLRAFREHRQRNVTYFKQLSTCFK